MTTEAASEASVSKGVGLLLAALSVPFWIAGVGTVASLLTLVVVLYACSLAGLIMRDRIAERRSLKLAEGNSKTVPVARLLVDAAELSEVRDAPPCETEVRCDRAGSAPASSAVARSAQAVLASPKGA